MSMNPESQPKSQETGVRPESMSPLRARNLVQMNLAERFYGFTPNDEQMITWVNEHARTFSEIIDKNPQILGRYVEDPQGALDEIEHVLHEIESH